ncbi:MAG: SDR family NAD(P)-dependent oxidoreductase [Planctomycetaceae bacterium]|nr:SDR family NAD(P)-dependent oxidoreductase [Planctomycetaceae bacterium]
MHSECRQPVAEDSDPIVIVGYECAVPGADGVVEFAKLLFESRQSYGELPDDRFDRSRYYDARLGRPGKSYTTIGGIVPERAVDQSVCPIDRQLEQRCDPTHTRFCEVAARAWRSAGLKPHEESGATTGIFVGHSGGTKNGGPLSMAVQIEETLAFLDELDDFRRLASDTQNAIIHEVTSRVRQSRPQRACENGPRINAYTAAALAANVLGLGGPRTVIDAACASSLIALNQAMLQIRLGRIDTAVVGGATYNNVDNLILFSQSQACSADGCRPFDQGANGLISSEGYVAIVVTRLSRALKLGLSVRAIVRGIGISSDGKGKSLWAPRTEGQQLAVERAYASGRMLDIDYLEAHATSTQLGDPTELTTIANVMSRQEPLRRRRSGYPLLIGSVKSNLGHTLEAAGLIGLVKVLLSLDRNELPPSLGFEEPNRFFDWSKHPIKVLTHRQPWRETDHPRTAAVSAFGIGGLNAHVTIEDSGREKLTGEPSDQSRQSSYGATHQELRSLVANGNNEPIAIVGRGVVLPGAHTRDAFAELLRSGASVIGEPPDDRWRGMVGLAFDDQPRPFQTPTNRGGYIRDYEFNSQPFRIPPKQVAQANPVQMMLLDAVTQAIGEYDGSEWTVDRQRTGVVIGTVFGGEFAIQLQAGLRLPEIADELKLAIDRHANGRIDADRLASEFRQTFLQHRPALLDETGSFTSSTLASRVAKTFDLMGGACALDADDASGLAALTASVDQLRSGQVDTVLCGSAQRTMDLAMFEVLDLSDQLVRSGRAEDIPDDCRRTLPGEGVVMLMLQRMSDAKRGNRPILGVIHNVESRITPRTEPILTKDDASIVRQIGYLPGAHSLIRLVAATLQWQDKMSWPDADQRVTAKARAEDGYTISATVSPSDNVDRPASQIIDVRPPKRQLANSPSMSTPVPSSQLDDKSVIRLEARTEAEFRTVLTQALEHPESLSTSTTWFRPDSCVRAVLLDSRNSDRTRQLQAMQRAWDQGTRNRVFERERVVLSSRNDEGTPRVAWVFPGQGSQYDDQPTVLRTKALARDCIAEIDQLLEERNVPPLSAVMNESRESVGSDVWWSQLWALGVGTALMRSLIAEGLRPDVVAGHSFGEYNAALAAGVLTLPQALRITKMRADAVVMSVREQGALLSVRGAPAEVHAVIRGKDLPVVITHYNAPEHTVVAGLASHMDATKAAFMEAKLASIKIPVAAAFHTEAMRTAENLLARGFAGETLRPPSCGFLSTTSTTYLAEPDDVRNSLVTQLTQPVMYEPAIRRLLNDGVGLFVEVGPNDVLTRLNREIIGSDALCLSADVPGQSFEDRLVLIHAAIDCMSGIVVRSEPTRVAVTTHPLSLQQPRPVTSNQVEIVDVSRMGRRKDSPSESWPRLSMPRTNPTTLSVSSNGHAPDSPEVDSLNEVSTPPPEQVTQFLKNIVVELTGYSEDVVDEEADLEADLGIDSIKKAQIIGELAAWTGLRMAPENLRLAEYVTLNDIATLAGHEFVVDATTLSRLSVNDTIISAGVTTNSSSPSSIRTDVLEVEPPSLVEDASSLSAIDPVALETLLIDFVVDQTGYSRDIVDLDADLEADLGLDSIKTAQLLGELTAQFDLSHLKPERMVSVTFPTLRSIQDFLIREVGNLNSIDDDRRAAIPSLEMPPRQNSIEHQERPVSTVLGIDPREEYDFENLSLDDQSFEARAARRTLIDRGKAVATVTVEASSATIAKSNGADVTHPSPRPPVRHAGLNGTSIAAQSDSAPQRKQPSDSRVTHRFALRVVDVPHREGMPIVPVLTGPALIVGDNPVAHAIANRMAGYGQSAYCVSVERSIEEIESELDRIWSAGPTPHLFVTTAHDTYTLTSIDLHRWNSRRSAALSVPFRICQRWMQETIDAKSMDDATAFALVNLGGDFGFSGGQVQSVESIGGLLKAMLIEGWTAGYRHTPMKVIDVSPETSPDEAAEAVFREMAVNTYDMEIATDRGARRCVQAVPATLNRDGRRTGNDVTPGGAWILTGGGRGITALTGMELAQRHNLKLHLIGTAPPPDVDEQTRLAAITDRGALRRKVMQESMSRGQNGVEAWRDMEKAVEIAITLADCRQRGIQATYHSCNVADLDQLTQVVARIREQDGPIRGVIHGAGAGQDSRFDRKRPDKVEKCLKAKIDGALAVMEATRHEPLEWFVAFGSISGRFGANGHTDYSLANDMMAKIVDRYRVERPEVTSLTFHWHAWGDVGMAMKPEAKLALEMIDLEFMPAIEGVAHFLNEFKNGGDEPEVLITDYNYIRKFFPTDRATPNCESHEQFPLLQGASNTSPYVVTLDPEQDKFLAQHRVGGLPTLPFVVALELLAEGARRLTNAESVIECRNVRARQALKCMTSDAIAVQIAAESVGERKTICKLQADVRRRDGRLVEEARTYFEGEFTTGRHPETRRIQRPQVSHLDWYPIEYPDQIDGPIYHGPEFRSLVRVAIDADIAYGFIGACAPVQMFGADRPSEGWTLTADVMDACLYTAAVFAWRQTQKASLPVSFDRIQFARLPDPGETCIVRIERRGEDSSGMTFAFELIGHNGDMLMEVDGYRVAWLS